MRARPVRDQRGVTLLVALLLLIAVLLVGASAARMAWQGEKAARAERDRHIALQAAEDALMDAESDIDGTPGMPSGRSALFAGGSARGFADGCTAAGNAQGLCAHAAADVAPVWQSVDLGGDDGGAARSVEYGQFSGAPMQTGVGFLPFKRPRYIIERMICHRPGEEAGATSSYCYRVTAIGFGARPATEAVLQTVYRRPE